MAATKIKGGITETVKYYDPAQWEAWKKGDRTGFPMDPRLAHFIYRQPQYYFGETLYVRELLKQGFLCWQERYQLFKPLLPSSNYHLYSEEIASLMGKRKFNQLQNPTERIDFSPVNPDVVAFHPVDRLWAFYEVKMPHDKVRNNQICSLALLRYFLEAQVGVIRFIPTGKAKRSSTYEYSFIVA